MLVNRIIIALAMLSSVLSGTALAQGASEAEATVITSLPVTYDLQLDPSSTPPDDPCDEDTAGAVYYKYTTGSNPESVTFFTIGEDTELMIYEEGATDDSTCVGGDNDDDPTFIGLGITAPAGFNGVDISNSEIFTETLSPNTTYIILTGLHSNDAGTYDHIVFGVFDSAGPAAEVSGASAPLSVNTISLGGLLVMITLIMGVAVFVVRGRL